jgi:hypothetical protein
MSSLVTVNPQVHCHAVAFWLDGKLVGARVMLHDEVAKLAVYARDHLVIETPQVYEVSKWKGDPKDLIDLAFSAGRLSALFEHVKRVLPSEWKGQIPKPKRAADEYIIEHRARKRLTPDELKGIVVPSSAKLKWDVWDAVAIGLRELGRK